MENRLIEIGIRPEHLEYGASPRPDAVSFAAIPEVVEPTGADTERIYAIDPETGIVNQPKPLPA